MKKIIITLGMTVLTLALAGCMTFNPDGLDLNAAKDIACNAVLNNVIAPNLPEAYGVLEQAGIASWICNAIQIEGPASTLVTLEQVAAKL